MAYGLMTYNDRREDLLDIVANISPQKISPTHTGYEPNYSQILRTVEDKVKEKERGRLLEKWMNMQKK